MFLKVRVVPRSSRNLIKEENGILKAYLTKPAQEGLANEQLIRLLARHLGLKKYQLRIVAGLKSRDKIIETDV
ncbi:MAG: DUF167 domain-containing protein [Candidatus Omnitrophota bacterium]